ncbi:hypothetical protein B1A99_22110 [Cohnella sp. CIP 111063]|uniref:ABC transporter ATP-binding protein n=1 Tax=unclassified Cohnella TaxID=2636738 RepID=UPI000B8C5238|nr:MULTISPECIES: ATP-binding cassette domain-containing protein [unclassified Cohnella]OXS55922.1 hypothetical protein B1A99_22110 [Cohnella sp. CIP 111063]
MASITLENAGIDFPVGLMESGNLRSWIVSRFNSEKQKQSKLTFEALSPINASFHDGERIGLIGSNGAGKTTFLKMLAGVYLPTRGNIYKEGNTSTLFDLYLGMDDEASGYENIRIASSVLGFKQKEISHVVKDVEQFTELGEALYRPLRTYSAGMRVRLAFCIATSIDTDIMLIDEIIGVGDNHFLEKAKQRMLNKVGQTKMLFLASHAYFVLKDFCHKGLVFSKGKIVYEGNIDEAIDYYDRNKHVL